MTIDLRPPRDWDDDDAFEFDSYDRDLADDDLSDELDGIDLESEDFGFDEDDDD